MTGAPDLATARAVSKSVIHSTLFKAAMFGADANWGRVLCAIGYTPGDFDISKTSVRLKSKAGEVFVCENAAYHPYSEDEAAWCSRRTRSTSSWTLAAATPPPRPGAAI